MMDYLHIDAEVLIENPEETTLSFVQENANPDATEEDIEFYRDMDYLHLQNMEQCDQVIAELLKDDRSVLLECDIDPMDLVK